MTKLLLMVIDQSEGCAINLKLGGARGGVSTDYWFAGPITCCVLGINDSSEIKAPKSTSFEPLVLGSRD
jgi:hypothetical protein